MPPRLSSNMSNKNLDKVIDKLTKLKFSKTISNPYQTSIEKKAV